jgi:RNA polymerase sigma-54 factor
MMTPMMQQAVALLLMSTLELQAHIDTELETNPTLDLVEPESDEPPDSDETAEESSPRDASGLDSAAAATGDATSAGGVASDSASAGADGIRDADGVRDADSIRDADSVRDADPEIPDPEPAPADEPRSKQEIEELDYANLFSSEPRGPSMSDPDSENVIEETTTQDLLLSDYLLEQLSMAAPPPAIAAAARHLVSRLDHNGYLGTSGPAFAEATGIDPAVVAEALALVQSFDPPGVGAADLRECLLFQLQRRNDRESIAYQIVDRHLDDLSRNRLPAIGRALNREISEINAAIDVIRALEPRPGRSFGASETNYIVPDVVVEKVNGEYIVSLKNDRIPTLRVSPEYLRLFEAERRKKGEVGEYLKHKLESAFWLIKSIEQRQNTIYRVAESIVRHQVDFLEYGPKYLKPMTLRVVAEDLGIHESTVSRVTTQKYIQTPRGTFELKYFFSSPIETSSGEDASSRSVKTILAEVIAGEDARNPLSDQKLSEMMGARGFTIARRTITKYREQLKIQPAKQRQKFD